MEEYDIEPFMPGISPIGKGTPAMKEFSVARPYIPDGTGYNTLRFKPGQRGLRSKLDGLGRVSYVDKPDGGRHYIVEKAPDNYLKDAKSPDDYSNKVRAFDKKLSKRDMYGWYDPVSDTIITKNDALKPGVVRHEVAHALQKRRGSVFRPSTYTVTGQELDARIVQNKGIRKGMKHWAMSAPYYTKYWKGSDLPGEGKVREVVARGMGKAAELIPNTPGNLKVKVPTGLGANLIDVFSLPPLNYSMPHETHDIFGQPLDQGAGFEPEMIPSHNEFDYEVEPLEYPDQGGTLPMTYGPKMIPNPRAGQAINPYGVI